MKNLTLINLLLLVFLTVSCSKTVEQEDLGRSTDGSISAGDNGGNVTPLDPIIPPPNPTPIPSTCGLHSYDINQNYIIEKNEVLRALADYHLNIIHALELYEVLYLSKGSKYKCETDSNGNEITVLIPKDPTQCWAHYLDTNQDFKFSVEEVELAEKLFQLNLITQNELNRIKELAAGTLGYKCDTTQPDGYNIILPPIPNPTCKPHDYDTNKNFKIEKNELKKALIDFNAGIISLSLLERLTVFYYAQGYKCKNGTVDGYDPIPKPTIPNPPVCKAHIYDTNKNFKIEKFEFERATADFRAGKISISLYIQVRHFYNSLGYKCKPGTDTDYIAIPLPIPVPPPVPACKALYYDFNKNFKIEKNEFERATADFNGGKLSSTLYDQIKLFYNSLGYKCKPGTETDYIAIPHPIPVPTPVPVCKALYYDFNKNFKIEKNEFERATADFNGGKISSTLYHQIKLFYNSLGYKCKPGTETDYMAIPKPIPVPTPTPTPTPIPVPVCKAHPYDTNKNFKIENKELDQARADYKQGKITLTQFNQVKLFFNSLGYKCKPGTQTDYIAIPKPPTPTPIPTPTPVPTPVPVPEPVPVCKPHEFDKNKNYIMEKSEFFDLVPNYLRKKVSIEELREVAYLHNGNGYKCELKGKKIKYQRKYHPTTAFSVSHIKERCRIYGHPSGDWLNFNNKCAPSCADAAELRGRAGKQYHPLKNLACKKGDILVEADDLQKCCIPK